MNKKEQKQIMNFLGMEVFRTGLMINATAKKIINKEIKKLKRDLMKNTGTLKIYKIYKLLK